MSERGVGGVGKVNKQLLWALRDWKWGDAGDA
jgi:hypothetical protein